MKYTGFLVCVETFIFPGAMEGVVINASISLANLRQEGCRGSCPSVPKNPLMCDAM